MGAVAWSPLGVSGLGRVAEKGHFALGQDNTLASRSLAGFQALLFLLAGGYCVMEELRTH